MHHGVVNGAVIFADRYGNKNGALYFDGIDDYITIKETSGFEDFNDPGTEFTLSAWCYPGSGNSGFIFSNTSEDGWHDIRMSNLVPGFGVRDVGWIYTVLNPDEPISANEWHHIVCTFDNPYLTIYVDGKNKVTTHIIRDLLSSGGWENGGVRIGVSYLLDSWYYKGGIDDIRIFNRGLSETEILELYTG